MKLFPALLGTFALTALAADDEPLKKPRSTVPAPYPSIIRMDPVAAPKGKAAPIFQSELGGRELQFFQKAAQAGVDQLALVGMVKGRSSSEQIKAVAEMLATTQATESKEIARLTAAKKTPLGGEPTKTLGDELKTLADAKFEKAWIERLITVNESSVAAYETGAGSQDADVRSFAEKMLPVAKARLQMANRLGGHSEPTPAPVPGKVSAATPAPAAARGTPAAPPDARPAAPAPVKAGGR